MRSMMPAKLTRTVVLALSEVKLAHALDVCWVGMREQEGEASVDIALDEKSQRQQSGQRSSLATLADHLRGCDSAVRLC